MSAMHEVFERTSGYFLGRGEGIFFIGTGDEGQNDTRYDVIFNIFGAFFGTIVYLAHERKLFSSKLTKNTKQKNL
jgi:uncharacterized membrane protein YjdF